MSEVVRLYQHKSLLSGHRAVSAQSIMAALEIWRATLKRDIAKLRDDIRSFSIDAITRFEVLDTAAKELAPKRIDESVGAG